MPPSKESATERETGSDPSARGHGNDPQPESEPLDLSGAPGSIHDQVKGRVIVQIRDMAVQIQEDHRGQPGQPLVAVCDSVVASDRVQERRRLELETG